ncbi:YfhO family protein [Listeria costaricensis]|uniref:YfhO family protein n=1 Tax=Listeria costaricensis TaxID=2026604 RepID=UPI000C07AFAA|nr:YfhO family protein [Listeria costaricensis]
MIERKTEMAVAASFLFNWLLFCVLQQAEPVWALTIPFAGGILLFLVIYRVRPLFRNLPLIFLGGWLYLPLLLSYIAVIEHTLSVWLLPLVVIIVELGILFMMRKKLQKVWMEKANSLLLLTLAGLLPMLLVIAIQTYLGIGVSGDATFLAADLKSQYVSYHYLLYDLLTGQANWSYTFTGGLGLGTFSLIGYYLMTPFSFLVVLFQKDHIVYFMQFVFWAKVFMSGMTMMLYLRHHYKDKFYSLLLFSTAYALCGYVVVYQSNIMWLDAVYAFPIVLLGVEHLLKNKKYILLILALAFSFITNFYMGYMVAIGTSIYWLIRYLELHHWQKGAIKQFFISLVGFAISGITAALLAAPVIVPVVTDIFAQPRMDSQIDYTSLLMTDPLRSLAKLFSGVTFPMVDSANNAPNDYIGLLALLCVLLFLFNRAIPWKSKILWVLGSLFFVLATQNQGLYYAMHGFALPNGWPYRFIFLLSAFLIIMAARTFMHFSEVRKIWIWLAGIVLIGVVYFVSMKEPDLITADLLKVNIFIIIVMVVFLTLLQIKNVRNLAWIGLIIIFVFDFSFNTYQSNLAYPAQSKAEFWQDSEQKTTLYQAFNEQKEPYERIGQMNTGTYSNNDSFRYGFDGVTNYNTMTQKNLNESLGQLGFSTSPSKVWMRYTGSTLVTDALFNVGYNLTQPSYNIEKYGYQDVATDEPFVLQENQNNLGIGFMMNADYQKLEQALNDPQMGYFDRQNILFSDADQPRNYFSYLDVSPISMTGGTFSYQNGNLVINKDADSKEAKLSFEFNVTGRQQLYFSNDQYAFTWDPNTRTQVYVNGKLLSVYQTSLDGRVADLGTYENEPVKVTIVVKKDSDRWNHFKVAALDLDAFDQRIHELATSELEVKQQTDDQIEGTITAKEKGDLFLSIPYSKGWTAYVDGEKTALTPVLDDGFMTLSLEKGTHKIELNYHTPGLKIGLIMFGLGILILLGGYLLKRYFRKGTA